MANSVCQGLRWDLELDKSMTERQVFEKMREMWTEKKQGAR
jgi:hypothetical protein